MELDTLKREFILRMDEIYGQFLFPKNFFGCIIAFILERHPITQDRLISLTGYSRSTISAILSHFPFYLPLKTIKSAESRKYLFYLDQTLGDFFFMICNIMFSTKDQIFHIYPDLIQKARHCEKQDPRFQIIAQFFEEFLKYMETYFMIFENSKDELAQILLGKNIESKSLLGKSEKDNEVKQAKILLEEKKKRKTRQISPYTNLDIQSTTRFNSLQNDPYLKFKHYYFQKLRESMVTLNTKGATAWTIIIHYLLIEPETQTQEEIQIATQYRKTQVSDTLGALQNYGLIQSFRKPGELKKRYQKLTTVKKLGVNKFMRSLQTIQQILAEIDHLKRILNQESVKINEKCSEETKGQKKSKSVKASNKKVQSISQNADKIEQQWENHELADFYRVLEEIEKFFSQIKDYVLRMQEKYKKAIDI